MLHLQLRAFFDWDLRAFFDWDRDFSIGTVGRDLYYIYIHIYAAEAGRLGLIKRERDETGGPGR